MAEKRTYEVRVDVGTSSIKVHVDTKTLENLRKRDPDTIELVRKTAIAALHEKTQDTSNMDLPVQETQANMDLPDPVQTTTTHPMSEWIHEAELMLLDIFRNVENGKIPHKRKWLHISTLLTNQSGGRFSFSSEQCRLKIKNLKERQAKLQFKRNKSGEEAIEDDLEEELDDVFQSLPDINPKFIIESMPGPSNARSNARPSYTISTPDSESRDSTPSPVPPVRMECSRKRTHLNSPVSKGNTSKGKKARSNSRRSVDVLKDVLEERDMAAERRHKEKMTALNSLLDIMKNKM